MLKRDSQPLMVSRVVDSLYVEAMLLTDEARAYFDEFSRAERTGLAPVLRVSFSCESLKVTTRLMHIIAWLLASKTRDDDRRDGQFMLPMDVPQRLGSPVHSDPEIIANLPVHARHIIESSIDLYLRVSKLEEELLTTEERPNPAHALQKRVRQAF